MITTDPVRRAAIFSEVRDILAHDSSAEDQELLLSFATVTYAEMPDALALKLEPSVLAQRLHDSFRFVVRTVPPAVQLYKGLPGLHVVVQNPQDAAEATIVETHTLDAPFIFESLKNYFQKEGLRVFSAIHPIFTVRRQWERIVAISSAGEDGSRELYCQFRIERVDARDRLRRIEHQVHSVLKAIFLAVEDFPAMTRAARDIGPRLRSRHGDSDEGETARAFLNWLLDDNYVLLGMLRYRPGADGQPHPEQETALGVFNDPALLPVVFLGLLEHLQAHIKPEDYENRIIDIDYSSNASAIHQLEPVDDIVVREWAPDGSLACATLLLGRLAKGAFTAKAQQIPLLAEKLRWILERSGAASNSHAYRETRALFNRFPKRELLYADASSLKDVIDRMVYMSGDDEIIVTTRQGKGYHAVCIAFSDLHYSHKAEEDLSSALAEAFGPISFNTWADCGVTALLLFYFDASTLEHPIEVERVRSITERVITTWEDRTGVELEKVYGPLEGRRFFRRYVRTETRSGLYRETTPPEEVPGDVRRFEQLEDRLEIRIVPHTPESLTLKLFSPTPLDLTDSLRKLQHLGLNVRDEMTIPLVLPSSRRGFLQRLRIEARREIVASMIAGEDRVQDALRALHEGRSTSGHLNGLILREGLNWRDVELLRTLRNHVLQMRPTYNADTMATVMLRNSKVSSALFRLFEAKFDPALEARRSDVMAGADDELNRSLAKVSSLFDDEILRGVASLVRSAVRTNFYQRPERPVLSVKVDSRKVEALISPRPLYEIYVHSPRLEGIHLRGGKVARGGIRWSDRHDDFRTEILGLMKTQMLKNAIIVPVGSKGGFVLKGTLPPRPGLDAYLVDRYREFISGLLDVTDNRIDGHVAHPPLVVIHDEDDPYLVVAADKGTAHLSDTANHVSEQYGFWLGDAFASGGSHGYDHKREGITARGAWECVKHFFLLLGTDVQTQPFTMAGIGDMSGDVFGNGVLRSRTPKLVAAFNHQHIFIDPNPDPERSFQERERLFNLPRATWLDYDTSLLSQGGGIYERHAKSIPLSTEARALLDIEADEASGEEVIRHVLKARVDLLYNGGIGTYVKASTEEDAEVGDRSNDRVRVNASDLRARVLAEGGNLGLTQAARLEYWIKGGLINTDAVDNSGGVDMSDHEVNIKILLDLLVRDGAIKSVKERNQILAEMTDEVSILVLADNAHQARALTLDGLRSAADYAGFVGVAEEMIAAGILNRHDDGVPPREELFANPARDRGLPRPLLAVVLAHAKNSAFASVLPTSLPDHPLAQPFLESYFPAHLQARFRERLGLHPLRREIIATAAVNYLINWAGVSLLPRLAALTGQSVADIVAAYLEADQEVGARDRRQQVLANGQNVHHQHMELLKIEEEIEAAVLAKLQTVNKDIARALETAKAR